MGTGVTVSADVTPEFNERIEDINAQRDDLKNKSDTIRYLLREGAAQVDGADTFAQTLLKNAAIGFAVVALVGYLWTAQVGYARPVYVGVAWMIPAVLSLWLHQLWPGIAARFASSDEHVSPSEV